MVIDCTSCQAPASACADCVVSVLLGPPTGLREVAEEHRPALEALADAGLVPPLRLVPALPDAPAAPGRRAG